MKNGAGREFSELTVEEKIRTVQDLWDQIAQSPETIPLSDAQLVELERRVEEHEARPVDYTTWPELRRRLEGRS